MAALLSPPTFSAFAPARGAHSGRRRPKAAATVAARKGEDQYSSGRLVDEDMLVLRKRVQEVRMAEEGAREPPKDWMDWERRYHARYDSDVCEALGALQALLMATRPAVALAAAAVVGVSVPVAVGVVLLQVVGVVRMALTLVHL